MESIEKFFDGLGLMTGEYAVQKRMVFGAVIGGFIVTYIKPDLMFQNGTPRQWAFTKNMGAVDDGTEPTLVPWWVVPVAGAIGAGVFI